MKVAIVTMFNGLSSIYSLVNVVADQLQMLFDANISVKLLVSEHCPDGERTGVFADERIEWIKIINSDHDKIF
ncbi:MAG: glycosyltransferase, partial [Clostridia bacterium]